MLKILAAAGAAALAASALSTPAAAAAATNGDDETRIAVSYAGLDLSKPADAARLDRRLRVAARAVCGEATLDLSAAAKINACQADAFARAKADLRIALRSGAGRVVALRTN